LKKRRYDRREARNWKHSGRRTGNVEAAFRTASETEAKAYTGLKVIPGFSRRRNHHQTQGGSRVRLKGSDVTRRQANDRVAGIKPNNGSFGRVIFVNSPEIDSETRAAKRLEAADWLRETATQGPPGSR